MILIKRYGLPIVVAVVIYSLIYFIFGAGYRYFGVGMALSVFLSYLIRICDDIGDYESDKAKGKAPMRKWMLITLGAVAVTASICLMLTSRAYYMLAAISIILLQFLIKERYRDVIKLLFVPIIVITLVVSFFEPNFWLYVIVPILIVADALLIVYKRKRRGL